MFLCVNKLLFTMQTIRWGIIGCGDVTEVKSGPAYQKTEGFELTAVMRRNIEKAKDYALRHGVEHVFDDAGELINSNKVDAVYIATPPDSHKTYALQVAAAGKPCCIEKPMAPSYSDCKEITHAFEHDNVPLFVAYYRRSLPRFNQVKDWIDQGKIGLVRHIHWELCKKPTELDQSGKYNWRTDVSIAPGGYFDDLASHGLDLFAYYFGDFVQVQGTSTNQQNLYSAKDAIAASWKHKNGVTGTGYWNFGGSFAFEEVKIIGSEGNISFHIFNDGPLILETKVGITEKHIEHPENIQLYHVHNMREHLMGNAKHPCTGTSGCHASWVMDRILGNI